ncbi:DUF5134 domain-containing protein [Amycolatopsis rhabdoformis]|uniref:DUF5134 domain-containing protein n=1 Tax=Amycolatopsis rhabdoformis TaxID=1448059 RepID=A0ABZ1I6C2_9PSEU|nr:DUF5134 domain-containing protein [Amycolatopsis rhabdoformis]WSE29902.1 DUF5134 domain-containing protein [Amycolatopsis rhabdoformis]
MIADPVVRWLVTALFLLGAGECGYRVFVGRLSWPAVVGGLLHGLMAVAMAVLAWPRGAELPTAVPLVVFALATLWFVALTLGQRVRRETNLYYALTMLATAWMYASMAGGVFAVPRGGAGGLGVAGGEHGAMSMPGMSMPGMSTVDASPGLVTAGLNWLCTIFFAVAVAWWSTSLFVRRRASPVPSVREHLGAAAQTAMAAGMAIMFAVVL